ncbi:putative toxin-antitoxin system toxin component, PIN family [Limnobacter sp. CACIAM 66H1]|uniref:putative toxin-antitoxin system toxin component, PIN family n=1 Tax=Limnobacter sp. CACIAM 66H1 TaxID=1813033 RepID=UPI000B001002|nr:putative toxin-antitoxin system toxin component, PIN family [Limnobacter sp. CACIAM 66H1]
MLPLIMIVVIDTNVFISACLGNGDSTRVIEAVLLEKIRPLICTALINEYEAVLARPVLFKSSRLNDSERNKLLDLFFSKCNLQKIYFNWRPNLRDEADNHLIELAIAGNAEVIVTQNIKDFKGTELIFDGLRILSPNQLLKEV